MVDESYHKSEQRRRQQLVADRVDTVGCRQGRDGRTRRAIGTLQHQQREHAHCVRAHHSSLLTGLISERTVVQSAAFPPFYECAVWSHSLSDYAGRLVVEFLIII